MALPVVHDQKPDMDAFAHVRDAQLRGLLAHYLDLRQGQRVPRRSQISPLDFPRLLGNVFLYEFDPATQDFHIRLAGSQIAEKLQTAKAGSRLSAVFPPAAAPLVLERLGRVCRELAVMHNIGRVFQQLGGAGSGERIVMPLLDEDGAARFCIGATIYDLAAGAADPAPGAAPVTITYTPL